MVYTLLRTRSTSTSPLPVCSAPGVAAAAASTARATSPTAASVAPTGRMRSVRRRPSTRQPSRLSMALRARPWSSGTYSSPAARMRSSYKTLISATCRKRGNSYCHTGHGEAISGLHEDGALHANNPD